VGKPRGWDDRLRYIGGARKENVLTTRKGCHVRGLTLKSMKYKVRLGEGEYDAFEASGCKLVGKNRRTGYPPDPVGKERFPLKKLGSEVETTNPKRRGCEVGCFSKSTNTGRQRGGDTFKRGPGGEQRGNVKSRRGALLWKFLQTVVQCELAIFGGERAPKGGW